MQSERGQNTKAAGKRREGSLRTEKGINSYEERLKRIEDARHLDRLRGETAVPHLIKATESGTITSRYVVSKSKFTGQILLTPSHGIYLVVLIWSAELATGKINIVLDQTSRRNKKACTSLFSHKGAITFGAHVLSTMVILLILCFLPFFPHSYEEAVGLLQSVWDMKDPKRYIVVNARLKPTPCR